mgnify:FL=1
MPNTKWSTLSDLQLGKYGEYYSKMEFLSYGFYVYTPDIDDHSIDFIIEDKQGKFYAVQVKSIRKMGYVYITKKHKLDYICLLHFIDGNVPKMYVLPIDSWDAANPALVDRLYDKLGQKSKPEWGINFSMKNVDLLDEYVADTFLPKLLE